MNIDSDSFICECGRVFSKKQSLYAHMGHCKIHMGDREIKSHVGNKSWNKGRTKDDPVYGESIRRGVENRRKTILADPNYVNHLALWNRNKPRESYIRQAETRKRKYLSGELTPAFGVGRGKYSYFTIGDKTFGFRSTYEVIYALYLAYNNIEIDYETVRVLYKGKVYISDFRIENTVIEIKGNTSFDFSESKLAFESKGYDYKILFPEDMEEIYSFVDKRVNLKDLIEKITIGSNTKNYFHYIFCPT